MSYPKEYIDYLVHFHAVRDYFECHEILEEYWKEIDPGNRNSVWVGLIQIAVSLYHKRRGNDNGAKKLLNKSIENVTLNAGKIDTLGLSSTQMIALLHALKTDWEHGLSYHSIHLPITDTNLNALCIDTAHQLNLVWGIESNLADKDLVHRHMIRDRTDVILARAYALQQKEKKEN